VGNFIRIRLGIEEGEPSLCGGAPRAVIPRAFLKCPDLRIRIPKLTYRHSGGVSFLKHYLHGMFARKGNLRGRITVTL
jgi:hypothetical protein